jgi:hypothetical protein
LNNWEITGQDPYYPSERDIRSTGTDTLNILEIPITTIEVAAPGDTQLVKRYINPAYRPEVFKSAFQKIPAERSILAMHPYEAFPNKKSHSILSFNTKDFQGNLEWLLNNEVQFQTVKERADEWISAMNEI